MACTTRPPPIMMGRINRLMRNALVLTAAWYSRAAITSVLRMADVPCLRIRDADKDVVQRRPGQLEVADLAAGHQVRQQPLRVTATLQAQLLPAAEIGRLDNPRQVIERRAV